MPFADYVPDSRERNFTTYYRSVLGVPVRKRIIICVVTVFTLFLVFVCGLLISKYSKSVDKKAKTSLPGYVPLVNSMDTSVDPCTNFYNFTCGLWTENDLVPKDDSNRITTFSILQDFVKTKKQTVLETTQVSEQLPSVVNEAISFYKMCISKNNTDPNDDIKQLLNYFNQLMNGWPILNSNNWDESNFDWSTVSALLAKSLYINIVASVSSIVDDNDNNQRIIFIKPPSYAEYHTLDDIFSYNMFYATLISINHVNVSVGNVSEMLDAIHMTEKRWRNNFLTPPIDLNGNRTTMTFRELNEKMPSFDWLGYVQLIMNDTLNEIGKAISDQDRVVVAHLEYLNASISGLQSENFTNLDLANLFGWFVAQKVWLFIPGLLWRYAQFSEYSIEEFEDIEKSKCADFVYEYYQCSTDYLYVHNSSHSGVSDGKVLVHYIKKAFKELITTSSWMDDPTKDAALLKLDSMRSIIGFPSYLHEKSIFEEMYKGFPKLTTSLLETYFQIVSYFTSLLVKDLKQFKLNPVYVSSRSVTDVSAYYDLQRNTFTLPLSMYNPPFYHHGGPWYLNFGAIGTIIGHEIMHGFDNMGGQRGSKGNLKRWWSNATAEEFRHRSDCFTAEYVSDTTFNVTLGSDIDTLDEDIADNEGFRVAYLAYKLWEKDNGVEESTLKNYSSDQMFFLSFGSIWCTKDSPYYDHHEVDKRHSRPRLRSNKVVSNSKYFSCVFNCPRYTTMNPDKKCLIW